MTKLIVKPTINWLSTFSDANLKGGVNFIIKEMTANPDYLNPSPTLAVIGAALNAFRIAMVEAAKGGMFLTAVKNARRAELVALVRQLANYVAVACDGNYAKLLGSGFPAHKPRREPIGRLKAPRTPRLSHGFHTGSLDGATRSVRGAFIYNWQAALHSAPDVVVQSTQSTGSKATLFGFTAGQIYLVRVNVVGATGPSDWSGPAQLMVV